MYRILPRAKWPSRLFCPCFITVLLFAGVPALAQKGEHLQAKPALVRLIDANLHQAVNQYKILMSKVPAGRLPKTFYPTTDKFETSDAGWWTSGFYSGSLFYLYEFSHDTALLNEAENRLKLLEPEQFNKGTHDLGFMLYCSFGNGLRLLDSPRYKDILLNGARSLSTRFNPNVGCIKSWDSKPWHYPVIIDNMMNLELLFWATHVSGDSSFYRIAVTHANTTMRNHYRPDYSSFHVVDYDSATGAILGKKTAQGYADSSAWARGQSWGLYGYTMVYRATHDVKYLEQARHIAHFLLTNPNLPADKIPYWDYNAPGIPTANAAGAGGGSGAGAMGGGAGAAAVARPGVGSGGAAGPGGGAGAGAMGRPGTMAGATTMDGPTVLGGPLRDASAAAIMASALIELSHYVPAQEARGYLDVAETIIVGLSSNVYKAVVGSNGGFLIRHSVGNLPGHTEVDVPLTYADYYFIEAMLRYKELAQK